MQQKLACHWKSFRVNPRFSLMTFKITSAKYFWLIWLNDWTSCSTWSGVATFPLHPQRISKIATTGGWLILLMSIMSSYGRPSWEPNTCATWMLIALDRASKLWWLSIGTSSKIDLYCMEDRTDFVEDLVEPRDHWLVRPIVAAISMEFLNGNTFNLFFLILFLVISSRHHSREGRNRASSIIPLF